MASAARASARPARQPRGKQRPPLHIVANRIDDEPLPSGAEIQEAYDLEVLQRTLELVTVVIRAEAMRTEEGRAPQYSDFAPGE